ncbi:unnamed protein product [Darwinula stevensoni]|uniref:Uncharacterized protein n=1 Tax=Darwinula stevensoni TaxID=69355 RepID=A0A7R8X337_9CRUS|nr:unnamed protein product [Darwinula stevensoni]CAG0884570.1 unnamed protein product [Darwinula stevensoni]
MQQNQEANDVLSVTFQDGMLAVVLEFVNNGAKVHAQRKFAQGCSLLPVSHSSTVPNSSPASTEKDCEERKASTSTGLRHQVPSTSGVMTQPKVEVQWKNTLNTHDFLTFLCFKGTPALPKQLENFQERLLACVEEKPSDPAMNTSTNEESPKSQPKATPVKMALPRSVKRLIMKDRNSPMTRTRSASGKTETARSLVKKYRTLEKKKKASLVTREPSIIVEKLSDEVLSQHMTKKPLLRSASKEEKHRRLLVQPKDAVTMKTTSQKPIPVTRSSCRDKNRSRSSGSGGYAPIKINPKRTASPKQQLASPSKTRMTRQSTGTGKDESKKRKHERKSSSSGSSSPPLKKAKLHEATGRMTRQTQRMLVEQRRNYSDNNVKVRKLNEQEKEEEGNKTFLKKTKTRSGTSSMPPKCSRIVTRPSRRTKEAAAMYLELIGQGLSASDDEFEDDSITLSALSDLQETMSRLSASGGSKPKRKESGKSKPKKRDSSSLPQELHLRSGAVRHLSSSSTESQLKKTNTNEIPRFDGVKSAGRLLHKQHNAEGNIATRFKQKTRSNARGSSTFLSEGSKTSSRHVHARRFDDDSTNSKRKWERSSEGTVSKGKSERKMNNFLLQGKSEKSCEPQVRKKDKSSSYPGLKDEPKKQDDQEGANEVTIKASSSCQNSSPPIQIVKHVRDTVKRWLDWRTPEPKQDSSEQSKKGMSLQESDGSSNKTSKELKAAMQKSIDNILLKSKPSSLSHLPWPPPGTMKTLSVETQSQRSLKPLGDTKKLLTSHKDERGKSSAFSPFEENSIYAFTNEMESPNTMESRTRSSHTAPPPPPLSPPHIDTASRVPIITSDDSSSSSKASLPHSPPILKKEGNVSNEQQLPEKSSKHCGVNLGLPKKGETKARWPTFHPSCGRKAEAPVYTPSDSEFQDPIQYIEKIRHSSEACGIAKIIPPPAFKPDCRVNDDMRFTAYKQYVHKMFSRWGPNVKNLEAIRKSLENSDMTLLHSPVLGGVEIDLVKLYKTVQSLGGLKQVIERQKWTKVAEMMQIPKTVQDRVTKLDDIYCKYLLPYETLSEGEREELLCQVEKEHEDAEASGKSESTSSSEEEVDDSANECVVKGRSISLSQFFRTARNLNLMFKTEEMHTNDIEELYWKIVRERNEHVCVSSGSIDCGAWGYGFPAHKNSPFSKHPWNLKVLTNNSGSLLRCLGPMIGVTIPTLHMGMLYSTCCWYRDPHCLPWIDYLHTGAPKVWYTVPSSQEKKFHEVMMDLVPDFCKDAPIWLPSDTAMVPPSVLIEKGISLFRTIQKPGEFVVHFPRTFTSSICTGYSLAESVYFSLPDWLDLAEKAFKDLESSCEPSMFSMDQLMLSIADDNKVSLRVLEKVEICEEDADEEEEMTSYCLLHAYNALAAQPTLASKAKFYYLLSEEELKEAVEKLEQRISSLQERKKKSVQIRKEKHSILTKYLDTMCPIWPFQGFIFLFILFIGMTALSGCRVSGQDAWKGSFDPPAVQQLPEGNTIDNREIAIVHPELIELSLSEPVQNISFKLEALFLGYTTVELIVSDAKEGNVSKTEPLSVEVIRKHSVLDRVFIYSIIGLLSLAYINMGCALDLQVIKHTLRHPIGPVVGLIAQYIYMPLMAYLLATTVLDLPASKIALFVTGVCPGGGASNMWTILLGGNINLSITLTFLATLFAFVAMPGWLFTLGSSIFKEGDLVIPYENIATLALGLIIPVSIGVGIRYKFPGCAHFMVRIIKPAFVLLIIYIVIFGIYTNLYILYLISFETVVCVIVLIWSGFLVGALLAFIFRFPLADIIAIGLETGIQNTGVGIVLLRFSLPQPEADLSLVFPILADIVTPLPPLVFLISLKCVVKSIHIPPSRTASFVSEESEMEKQVRRLSAASTLEDTPLLEAKVTKKSYT